jgi:cobalt/nickel transport system permease protein
MHQPLIAIDAPATRATCRWPANAKAAAALTVILGTVAVPLSHAAWLMAPAVALLIALAISRVSIPHLVRRVLILEPFVLGVAILSLFQPHGVHVMLLLVGKCTICIATLVLLSASTSVSELIQVLRSARIPSLLITTMLLMHRYLFVLSDEARRMNRARACRTFRNSRRFQWQSLCTIIGQLFIRSADRADRVYAAMCARGWR